MSRERATHGDKDASTKTISISDICRGPGSEGHGRKCQYRRRKRLTRGGGLIAGGRARSALVNLAREISSYIFRRSRSKLMGARDTGTPLTSFGATLRAHYYTLIGPRLAMHHDDDDFPPTVQSIAATTTRKQGNGENGASLLIPNTTCVFACRENVNGRRAIGRRRTRSSEIFVAEVAVRGEYTVNDKAALKT